MRAHGRGLVLLRSFPRSSLETVLDPFTLLRACVPRLPPRAAEPASPSTMLLQARKCMRTRQSTATDSRDPPEAHSKGAAPGARCRGRLSRALPSGAVNRGVASRRSRAGARRVGSIPGSEVFWALFRRRLLPQTTCSPTSNSKLLSLLLPQNPATALAAHARARKLAG